MRLFLLFPFYLMAVNEAVWTKENLAPFRELMFSWNAPRPSQGEYLFSVRVYTDAWSPWITYASWGSQGQKSFADTATDLSVRGYQDIVEILNNAEATGVQIRVVAEGGAPLDKIHGLHVYTDGVKKLEPQIVNRSRVELLVPGISQMRLDHERHRDLCSPTATTAVVRYLSQNEAVDPVHFAQNVWDGGFDIFGNWVFNVAQAANVLGEKWDCWVDRLISFDAILERLHQGTPVVVSVRGPLAGSAQPYAKGHLLAVTGYDPEEKKVLCMDSAFPTDAETHVMYDLEDFVTAWGRRGNLAYLFSKKP